MKLSKWAKAQGICYTTAYRWFNSGLIPNAVQLPTGTILVQDDKSLESTDTKCPADLVKKAVIYARVSNHARSKDLSAQAERCEAWAAQNGLSVIKVYKEISSGMNDKRKKLTEMLEAKPTIIIIEHKDRLTRFGFNYLKLLLSQQSCEIMVINETTESEVDLMTDMISIITSFCYRLYGLRRGRSKSKEIKEKILKQNDEQIEESEEEI